MANLIAKKEKLFDLLEGDFVNHIEGLQDDWLEAIEKKLKQFDRKNGRFVGSENANKLILELKRELKKIVDNSDYESGVDEFLHNFSDIDTNIKMIQKEFNGIGIRHTFASDGKKAIINSVRENLLGVGIDERFITPVKKALFSHVNLGSTVIDTEKQLRIMIVGEKGQHGMLDRWAGQVARDSMQQYEGYVNQKIKDEYELNATMYVGSLVTDSRAQCKRWVKKEIIMDKDLEKEIAWAKTNGSGMIPSTTPETFAVTRGGWNCRHTAIPVRR